MSTTTINPSIEQVAYALAEAAYKASTNRVNAAFAALPADISDDDYLTEGTRIETETNHAQHVQDWHCAAEALAGWTKARLETDPECAPFLAAHRESVDYMFANWRKYRKIHDQFMSLCMSLENKPIPASYTAYRPCYPPYAQTAA